MLTDSPTELATSATDAVLAVECAIVVLWLRRTERKTGRTTGFWRGGLLFLGIGAVLGAVAHGIIAGPVPEAWLWRALFLSLALVMAFFVTASVADWRGPAAARRLLPWTLLAGAIFFYASELFLGAFIVFIIYEAVALVIALGIYLFLAATSRLDGALLIAWGIALSLFAAWCQISDVSLQLIVPFDRNGVFHLVQMAAVALLGAGVRAGGNNRLAL